MPFGPFGPAAAAPYRWSAIQPADSPENAARLTRSNSVFSPPGSATRTSVFSSGFFCF